MPERPDLRQISHDISDALAGYDREALADILTYVFKEYVVQGPPPLRLEQAERIDDLEGMTFAGLITALQTRLDVEELGLFEVEGEQVSVRVDGMKRQLSSRDVNRREPPAPSQPTAPAPVAPPVTADSRGDTESQPQRQAPRPTRGLSIASTPQTTTPSSAPAQLQADTSPGPVAPGKQVDGDDASVRFSLLEFD